MSAEPATAGEDGGPWLKLDRRGYAVTSIAMLGVALGAGIPTGVGIASSASLGTALLWVVPPGMLLVLAGALWEEVRWRKTRYRVGAERIELRSGILIRTRRSLHRDRIRKVDVTADPVSRIFGLVNVKIGTGEHADSGESSVALWPVTRAEGDRLRADLLTRQVSGGDVEGRIAALDPSWIRYAPLTFLSPLLGAGAFGGVMNVSEWFNAQNSVIGWIGDLFAQMSLLSMILVLAAAALIVGAVASLALFVEMWWQYRLDREPGGTLRVRRGLLTTRSISLEEKRLRGIEFVEPLGTRLAGAARVDALVTGMSKQEADKTDHKTLLPAAPKETADRVAAEVVRERESPTSAVRLTAHPIAARGRRLRWSVGSALVLIGTVAVLGLLLTDVLLHLAWIIALPLLPISVLLARDAYRGLGHGITGDYLVARSGSVRRSTVALQRRGVIGWTAKQSIFQRRKGLITLTATTAAGSGAYSVIDVGEEQGLVFAEEAVPDLFAPFLERGEPARSMATR